MYQVKAVKATYGMEGPGFLCNLYKGNKKVATCADYGDGGSMHLQWLDATEPKVETDTRIVYEFINDKFVKILGCPAFFKEKNMKIKMTPEEYEFEEFIKKECLTEVEGVDVPVYSHDVESYICHLVDQYESSKYFKRKCRDATCFRLKRHSPDEYIITRQKYTPAVRAALEKEYGDNLTEIINERFVTS
jgi:hypothetical protein